MLRFDEIDTLEHVRAWLSGPLMDALAPLCDYAGNAIEYASLVVSPDIYLLHIRKVLRSLN